MRILVTNDDGIHSPGLWSVAEALKPLGEVIVVAPDRDQSGISAAMTLLAVVRAEEVQAQIEGVKAFSVEGTPGDCVILANGTLVKEPFDLVVSGINQGANFGLDIMNSGTVGAAFHGYFRGIPSIAVSVGASSELEILVVSGPSTSESALTFCHSGSSRNEAHALSRCAASSNATI